MHKILHTCRDYLAYSHNRNTKKHYYSTYCEAMATKGSETNFDNKYSSL